jgi:hypothetical protein
MNCDNDGHLGSSLAINCSDERGATVRRPMAISEFGTIYL